MKRFKRGRQETNSNHHDDELPPNLKRVRTSVDRSPARAGKDEDNAKRSHRNNNNKNARFGRKGQAKFRNKDQSHRAAYSRGLVGFRKIEEWSHKEAHALMIQLTSHKAGFEQLLESELSNDVVVLILQLFAKVCLSAYRETRNEIMNLLLKGSFITRLKTFIMQLPLQEQAERKRNEYFWKDVDGFFDNVITVCKYLIETVPSRAYEVLPKTLKAVVLTIPNFELEQSVEVSCDIKKRFSELEEALNLCQVELERKKKEVVSQPGEESPPNDFRQLSIYPTSDEITSRRTFVRKNIVEGSYASVEHYLDVHFRLLKEDFVAPLREGVKKYIRRDKSRSNVKIHPHVEFVSPWLTQHQQLGAVLQFNMNDGGNRKKYKFLKRFMYGSLVCFTKDNFATIIFGKIIERTLELLDKGQVIVGFAPGFNSYELYQPYIMVECNVYFEPYYQVLKALQNTYESTFPMKKYIVDVDTSIESPDYLNEKTTFNINKRKVSVLVSETWPSADYLDLDDTQFSAFKAALTQKFSVIQGPPGTGKTYLGLRIASTLIQNKHVWCQDSSSPILVVCYTNHALDQFLEGLLDSTTDMVRVGAQSKNVKLEEFNLRTKRRNFGHLNGMEKTGRALSSLKVELGLHLHKIKDCNDYLEEIRKYRSIVHFKHFAEVDPDFAASWFATASNLELMDWLLFDDADLELDDEIMELVDQEQPEEQHQLDEQVMNRELDEMLEAQNKMNREVDVDLDLLDLKPYSDQSSKPIFLLHLSDIVQTVNEIDEEIRKLEHSYQQEDVLYRWELQEKLNKVEGELQYLQKRLNRGKMSKIWKKPNLDFKNPHKMFAVERWMLYFYWLGLYQMSLVNNLWALETDYREKYKQFEEIKGMEDTQFMKQMVVVGMTTTGAARLQTSLQELKCKIVIVEEAAEVLESHIIASLTSSCKHLILIGDHQQLRPSTADYRMEKDYNLGISLFERMVRNNIQCHTLGIQHRMRPEIAKLIVPAIYPVLENHESVFNYPPISGIDCSVYFIDHDHPEEASDGTTKRNKHEAKFLINLAYYLIQNGYRPEDITILAAYSGQMLELWKERQNKELLLKDVRITVLDNYQGEESKILLLSLVRNNSDNKIGFLTIENRVCVALSRAKEGFYIMGNMELLCQNSEIWPKVKEVLVAQKSLGKALALRCQVHPEVVTPVELVDDFLKVPEGGCSKMCEAEMSCGHKCPRICHVADRKHATVLCKQRCTRKCKNGHSCSKLCAVGCGPCQIIMQKTLPCSHEHPLQCSIDPEEYQCSTPVTVKLPCGHEVPDKPCSESPESFRCPFSCDARIEPCGHSCDRKCHIKSDPDHLRYKCYKPCASPKKNCSTSTHKCPLECHEECPFCEVLVLKMRKCFHHFKVVCSVNIDEVYCSKPCAKTLPCGHPCQSKCSDECGSCPEKVEKKHPICGHKMVLNCSEEPDIKNCKGRCPLTLKCGHPCKRRCNEPCTTKCRKLMQHTKPTACGHTFKIECYLVDTELLSTSYDLLKFCREPCKAILECSHLCSGTCGECAQGRIHKSCKLKCGAPLICGHQCTSPCREACQPCTRTCSYRCTHSACKKQCGEPCTRCAESCRRRCIHVWCKRSCWQQCSVRPCVEPCYEQLPCGHPCVGFCGDPCPPLCRVCNHEELTELFLGDEDEEGARFVLLDECKHVIESKGMERWLQQCRKEIGNKTCPKCKTPLTSTLRYGDYIKQAIGDVTNIKGKFFGYPKENEDKQTELNTELKELWSSSKQLFQELPIVRYVLEDFKDALKPYRKDKRQPLSKLHAKMYTSKIQIFSSITAPLTKTKFKNSALATKVKSYAYFLLKTIEKQKNRITNQEISDFERELNRFTRILQLCQIEDHEAFKWVISSKPALKELQQEISDSVFSLLVFTDELNDSLEDKIATLSKETVALELVQKERQQIVRAMGLTKGHWFKCPRGHYFAIGECGGAMQVGKCIECGEAVGGNDHSLLPGNRHTGELDGSQYAAWSETANNMFNYGDIL